MMDYFDNIDDYLNDRLSPEQKAMFDQELKNNQELARAVDNHDVVSSALELMLEEDIRSQMTSDMPGGADVKPAPWKTVAVIIVAIFILLFILNRYQNQQVDEDRLYAAHFKPYIMHGDRGSTSTLEGIAKCYQGHYYMTASDLDQAIIALEQSINENESCADKSHWLLGLTYLKTANIEQCKAELELVEPQSDYYDRAQDLLSKIN